MIVEELNALLTGKGSNDAATNKDFPLIEVFIIFRELKSWNNFYAFNVSLLWYDFDALTISADVEWKKKFDSKTKENLENLNFQHCNNISSGVRRGKFLISFTSIERLQVFFGIEY